MSILQMIKLRQRGSLSFLSSHIYSVVYLWVKLKQSGSKNRIQTILHQAVLGKWIKKCYDFEAGTEKITMKDTPDS